LKNRQGPSLGLNLQAQTAPRKHICEAFDFIGILSEFPGAEGKTGKKMQRIPTVESEFLTPPRGLGDVFVSRHR